MLGKVFVKTPRGEARAYSNDLKTQMMEHSLKKSV